MDHLESIEKVNYTIGEVAEILQVAPSLIRFWEKEFEALKPRKTAGGTRKYSREDLALLKSIYQLVKTEGHTLQGAREKLKGGSEQVEVKTGIIARLKNIRGFLVQLKNDLPAVD